eukprot:Gb_09177 [translate_table: standard]
MTCWVCKKDPAFQARPKYRDLVSRDHVSPQPAPDIPVVKPGLQRPLSFRNAWQQLKSVWDSLFHACELYGKGLMQVGAIRVSDLQEWKHSESIILNVGLPAYVLLQCFLRSVKSGSTGFIMRDGKELTRANRPEGRVFEWFFEPMSTMKDQIRSQDLVESEELYLLKLVLTLGDPQRMEAWDNGGIPPRDDKRRAELEALSRRKGTMVCRAPQVIRLQLHVLPSSSLEHILLVHVITPRGLNSSSQLGNSFC